MAQPSLKDLTNAAIGALQTGQNAQALELACMAAQNAQASRLQRLAFAMASERTMVPALAAQLKKSLEITLGHHDIDNQRFFAVWYYILKNSPVFAPLWEENFSWEKIQPALQDRFLLEGLKNLSLTDWQLEGIFTRLRRDLLLKHFPAGDLKTKHLPILCALAEHCFSNEYVFAQETDETAAIEKIVPADPVSVALIGCYKSLTDIQFDEKMSAVAAFRSMVKMHVTNARQEREMSFASGKDIAGDVSKNVQAMYEENPYPRWSSLTMPHMQINDIAADILLAGCGTGQTATGFAAALPGSDFTAIDLSRTSLAYASRMAKNYDLENVTFNHLNILDAATMGKTFDYIECSGVLHHMEDPEAGWKALTNCLKAGGGMQIALYSAKTRGGIEEVRSYIKEKGYHATPEDIRKLRADIAALPNDSALREVLRMRDFYSTSMVRDLVFHIQETTYDIPTIEAMMERLGLIFDGFRLNPAVKEAYRAQFPDDPTLTSLKNWDVFETENPDTFIGMYRILCHKKGEIVSDVVKRIREIQA